MGPQCGWSYDSAVADSVPDLSRVKIDRSAAPARRAGVLPWLLLVVVIAGGAWLGLARGWFSASDSGPWVELGRVQRIGGAAAQSGVAANGYVVARKQAALSTDIQGRLVELPVEEGTRVRAGDLVARLDTTQYEAALARSRHAEAVSAADVQRAEQELLRATAEVARVHAERTWAQIEYDRLLSLVESGDERKSALENAAATLDQAKASEAAAKAGAHGQEAAVVAAKASFDTALAASYEVEVLIEKSSVRAPFDGVITRKNAEIGEVVSAIGATGPNARGAVATLVDFSTLEVQVELAQTSLGAARADASVLIYLDAFPEQAYRGKVRQIWPTADRVKATVELRCEFLDRDDRILPEMGVRVVFVAMEAGPENPVQVLVPTRAIARGSESAVFLFESGYAIRRTVQLAEERADGLTLVASGLKGSELVILDPSPSLQDGAAVQRKEK